MKKAIRTHLRDFVALVALLVVALGVAGYILANQRFNLPASVPVLGKKFFEINGEFQTAKSITPGQGQTVTIAGVNVGEIDKVELVDGRARVRMKIEAKYASKIHPDATMLLRPKTGLEDMVVEVSPGSQGKAVPEGFTVPIQNTLPDVKFDQILASLDTDTRDYLRLLLNGAAQGLNNNGDQLAATFKRFEPGARDLRRLTSALVDRRNYISRSIHNLRLLVGAVGQKDTQLSQLIDSSNTVFRSFANQDVNLRSALRQLPPTLSQTRTTLAKVETLGNTLGPSLQSLRPTARVLGPTLRQVRPFLRISTPIIRDQIRPFARDVRPTIASLRPAARGLSKITPDLDRAFRVLNYLGNELAFNPPGKADEGYLFWNVWANHLASLVFGTGDAHGPIRRGTIIISCSTAQILDTLIKADPRLGQVTQLTNLPNSKQICPKSSQAGGSGDAVGNGGGRKR